MLYSCSTCEQTWVGVHEPKTGVSFEATCGGSKTMSGHAPCPVLSHPVVLILPPRLPTLQGQVVWEMPGHMEEGLSFTTRPTKFFRVVYRLAVSCLVPSCTVVSCRIASCHVASSFRLVSCHIASRCAASSRLLSYRVMSRRFAFWCDLSHRVVA